MILCKTRGKAEQSSFKSLATTCLGHFWDDMKKLWSRIFEKVFFSMTKYFSKKSRFRKFSKKVTFCSRFSIFSDLDPRFCPTIVATSVPFCLRRPQAPPEPDLVNYPKYIVYSFCELRRFTV